MREIFGSLVTCRKANYPSSFVINRKTLRASDPHLFDAMCHTNKSQRAHETNTKSLGAVEFHLVHLLINRLHTQQHRNVLICVHSYLAHDKYST